MLRKILLILLFPIIVNSQQIDCSLLKVTEVIIDNTNMTFDIAIYNGDSIGMSYPFVAYTINSIGDTIQQGNLNLFGAPGLDTTLYNYSITNAISSIYPLSIYFVYGMNSDTCILSYHPSCDSVIVNFDSLSTVNTTQLLHINIQTLDLGNSGFGYGGFILLNTLGDTIAQENINTAGNVFGLMSNNIENRILELNQNLSFPFYGNLHLVTGLFAGNASTSCIYMFNINNAPTNIEQLKNHKKIEKKIDILGRETYKTNYPLFYIFDDGTVEKRIIIQ